MRTLVLSMLLLVVTLATFAQEPPAPELPAPVMTGEQTNSGALRVEPDTGVSGEFGTWTVTCTVGPEGIATGGGIRVQLPDAWHSGARNSANRLQATDPAADHYISAKASRPEVRLRTVVEGQSEDALPKNARASLDGRFERYVYVVRVRVEEGSLQEGDTLAVVYGDTSGGSRGLLASAVSTGPLPVLAAVDARGDSRFRLLESRPAIAALPGKPVELQFHAPSRAAVGETLRLRVAMVDKESNPTQTAARVEIRLDAGSAEIPSGVEIPEGTGYAEFEAKATSAGVLRLRAKAEGLGLEARANPVDVQDGPVTERIYWGDIHSHTSYSWDGVGDDAYAYARYTAGLDFYAMTDHSIAPPPEGRRGLDRSLWREYLAAVEAHNAPGVFVTIPAYECSFGAPYGHHNVYFRNEPGPLLYPTEVTLPELWKALMAGDALTIPHHTGKFPRGLDLSVHDAEFRRNFEIYSAHGLSEAYDPQHPLAFEHSDFTAPSRSVQDPTFAQDVWKAGLKLSTVASSDDHRAHPGQPHYGLAAVFAPELTRDAVFQALYDRRTYGTTGAKIVLEATLNGSGMGQMVQTDGPPVLRVRALGTDTIAAVEILRYQTPAEKFEVVQRWSPNALDFTGEFTDETHVPGAVYYVRLRQEAPIRHRAVQAWSSPLWTEPKP
jgi:hypothetical protein